MGKTVYVLGAGFSKPAGFPLQRELYPKLVSQVFRSSKGVLGDPFLPFYFASDVAEFLVAAGLVRKGSGRILYDIGLEDLFTLLDRVIQDRGAYCGFGWSGREHLDTQHELPTPEMYREGFKPSLIDVRDSLVRCILAILHTCTEDHSKRINPAYERFSTYLLWQRVRAGLNGDPVSILSLNWDSLLEDSIYRVLYDAGAVTNGCSKADVDYCVYTNPLEGSPHTPSTKQRAAGIFNIKVLKLHGSATWLRCPNSNLVYTGLGSSNPAYDIYVKPRPSPLVMKYADAREIGAPPSLEPYIITPTFTKVFDLPQIQATWHNAYVELREAEEVVFIGYSLPEADYHFRALIRRAVRARSRVTVVLGRRDKADSTKNGAATRYRQVINSRRLSIQYGGIEGYVQKIVGTKSRSYTNYLKRYFSVRD